MRMTSTLRDEKDEYIANALLRLSENGGFSRILPREPIKNTYAMVSTSQVHHPVILQGKQLKKEKKT